MLFALGLLASGCSVIYLSHCIPSYLIISLWVSAAIISYLTLKSKRLHTPATIFFVAGILGACVTTVQITSLINNRLPPELIQKMVTITGKVADVGQKSGVVQYIDVKVARIDNWQPKRNVKVRVYTKQDIAEKSKVVFTAKLKPPHSLYNPAGFDLEKQYFYQGIIAQGNLKKLLSESSTPQTNLRQYLSTHVQHVLGQAQSLGVILALTLGDKSQLQSAQWQTFAHTGTSHLLAISGLHVATIAMFAIGGIGFLVRRSARLCHIWPAQCWAAILGLPLVYVYAFISGFALPTQRAVIMVTVATIALMLKQRILTWQAWSVAMVLVLLFDPLAPMVKGFWLSFICVAILIYTRPQSDKRLVKWLKPQFAIFILLFPISSYFFGGVSLASPLANLIAIPLVSFWVLPVSFVGVALVGVLPSLAKPILWLAAIVFDGLYWGLDALAQLPTQFLTLPAPSLGAVIVASMAGVILFSNVKKTYKAAACLLFMPLLINPLPVSYGEAKVTFLEVGQGLSVLVQTQKHTLLFDAGPMAVSRDKYSGVLGPYLQAVGIKRLDTVVISHSDDDHAGGLNAINSSKQILTSQPQQLQYKYGVSAQPCHRGQQWQWDGVAFAILAPNNHYQGKNNAGSCVLQINAGEHKILLTGDIDSKTEHQLVKHYGKALQSDILQAPHHGSKTSSSERFIHTVAPTHVVFSVGYYNHYHFPHKAIVSRYQAQLCQCHQTTDGAISFVLGQGRALEVQSMRQSQKRVWHYPMQA